MTVHQDRTHSVELQVQVSQRLLEAMSSLKSRYETMLSRLREMVVITDSTGTMLYLNPAWGKCLGYEINERLGSNLFEYVSNDCRETAERLFFNPGQEYEKGTKVRFVRQDGLEMWTEMRVSDMPEEQSRMCLMVDITEQMAVEQVLRDSAERFSLAMSATGESLWDWDCLSNKVRHNPKWCEMLGLDDGFLEHGISSFIEHIHEADRTIVMERIQNCLAGDGSYSSEHRMRRSDGSYIWVQDRGEVVARDPSGKALRMVGSFTDVSERKATQDALTSSEANLRQILEYSPEGVLAISNTNQVTFCNDPLRKMFGLQKDAGAKISMIEFSESLGRLIDIPNSENISDALRTGAREGKFRLKQPKRTIKWEARDLDSKELSTLLFFRDVTKDAEIDEMKSDFLVTAAHEFRAPMASIYGFVELMMTRDLPEEARKEYLGIIHDQTRGLVKMLNELLDLARIEARAGKDFRYAPHTLSAVLHKALVELNIPAHSHPVHIETGLEELPPLLIDESKIRQVIINVLSNAWKYSPVGGEIRISHEIVKDDSTPSLLFKVSDHGIGMSPEHQRKAFDRFFRADTSGVIPGTGLGLALVKEIMQIHGGSVDMESRIGSGTTVCLRFPITLESQKGEIRDEQ